MNKEEANKEIKAIEARLKTLYDILNEPETPAVELKHLHVYRMSDGSVQFAVNADPGESSPFRMQIFEESDDWRWYPCEDHKIQPVECIGKLAVVREDVDWTWSSALGKHSITSYHYDPLSLTGVKI